MLLTAEPPLQCSSDLLIATLMVGWVKKGTAKHIVAWGFEVSGKHSEVSSNIQELGRQMKAFTLPGLVIKGASCFVCRSKRATLPGVSQAQAGISRAKTPGK